MQESYQNIFTDVVASFPTEQQSIINNESKCPVIAVNNMITSQFLKKCQIPLCVLQAHEKTHQTLHHITEDQLSYIDYDVSDLYFYDGLCWHCLLQCAQNETGKISPAYGDDGETCIAYENAAITLNPNANIVVKYVNILDNDKICTKRYDIPYIIPQNIGCFVCSKYKRKIDVNEITFVKLHMPLNDILNCDACRMLCESSGCIDETNNFHCCYQHNS